MTYLQAGSGKTARSSGNSLRNTLNLMIRKPLLRSMLATGSPNTKHRSIGKSSQSGLKMLENSLVMSGLRDSLMTGLMKTSFLIGLIKQNLLNRRTVSIIMKWCHTLKKMKRT